MKLLRILTCTLVVSLAAARQGWRPFAVPELAAQSSQYVFVLHENARASEIAAAVRGAGGTVVSSMDEIGVVLASGLSNGAAARIAAGRAQVATDIFAQWTPSIRPAIRTLPIAAAAPGTASINKPELAVAYQLGLQWNMQLTDTDDAWLQQRTGIPSVRVAILDTGLDAYHIDQFGLIDVASSRAFVPSLAGPPDWEDDHTHGAYVGGIVTSNNFGVAGVAPNVTLVAVKVLDATGGGTVGNIIAGIYYAASVGVDVINMSIGAHIEKSGNSAIVLAAFNRAVNFAHARGVFVVAAAGNDAIDLQHDRNGLQIPCETGVLSCVSATGSLDLPAAYTNYGTESINNAAPGGDFTQGRGLPLGGVLSLCSSHSVIPELAPCKVDSTGFGEAYLFAEGTSAAAPHVAGLGAFLDSQFGGALNGSQILTAIQQNADDLGKPGADPFYGKGRMNTCRTLPGCVPVPNP
ncbi:MAG: hypothetical protein DMF85_08325 [Acidobacteria bacterium]|nr:MAG: hypothetical protein DMF85_08325 [Acidobacteriota bacterium]